MTNGRINGARRVEINLDESFGSCTARVLNGKEAGANSYIVHSLKDRVTPGRGAIGVDQRSHLLDERRECIRRLMLGVALQPGGQDHPAA